MACAEMRDDDERHAGIGRHRREKRLQRLDPAGRRTDAHNQKPIPGQSPLPNPICVRLRPQVASGEPGAQQHKPLCLRQK